MNTFSQNEDLVCYFMQDYVNKYETGNRIWCLTRVKLSDFVPGYTISCVILTKILNQKSRENSIHIRLFTSIRWVDPI